MLRETKQLEPTRVNFVLKGGAIGDYIAWMSSLIFIAKNFPHIKPTVYRPDYFEGIAENVLSRFPHCTVKALSSLDPKEADSTPTFIPIVSHSSYAHFCPVNSSGAHLVDMGFIYFANRSSPPTKEDGHYARLDLSEVVDPMGPTPFRIAVMTPGFTNPVRALPSKTFNAVKDYLIGRGITPVFLGKSEMTSNHKATTFADYDFKGGIDLTEETTLLEAAKIIEKAEVVVGLDNGLLHLAAMTDTPIVYGHNVIEPALRTPRRASGRIIDVVPDLDCSFCQSRQRFHFLPKGSDRLCPKTMSAENIDCLNALSAEKFISAIDEVLS